MPLTDKGEKIRSNLEREYGKEKGDRILYAGKNKGTFTGIDSAGPPTQGPACPLRGYLDACTRGDAQGMADRARVMGRR